MISSHRFFKRGMALIFMAWAFGFLFCPLVRAAGTLTINLIAVNASPTDEKEIEVKQDIPRELEPKDVVDTGELKLDYDVNRGVYFVHALVKFKPKESKTFKVKVNDVWFVSSEEVDVLKSQLENNVAMLTKHENYQAAQEARDDILKQLEFIMSQQKNYSDNISRRIEEYRAYKQTLDQIKNNIFSLDYLKFESKSLQSTRDLNKTVKFVIEVKNPSQTAEKVLTQKHYLPQGVRAEHVIERQGFEVRFDEEKQRSYLGKEETFKPAEVKKYQVTIKDIWEFPQIKADDLEERTKSAVVELKGTAYEEVGQYLVNEITDKIEKIREAQNEKEMSIQKHIGIYHVNQKRYADASLDFKRIEEMLAIIRAKKLEELESGKVKNVLSRLKALRGLQALSEALFKKAISVTTTWKIIMGAIIFVGFFTTVNFFFWLRRAGTMGEEMGVKKGEKIKMVPKPGEAEQKST